MKKKTINKDWADIAAFYREFATDIPQKTAYSGLADLCEFVASRWLNNALYGHLSAFDLRVSQVPMIFPPAENIQWLTIKPVGLDQLEFRFQQWTRLVNGAEAKDRFVRFLRQVGWCYQPFDAG